MTTVICAKVERFGRAPDQSTDIAYSAQCYRIIGRYNYDGYDKSYSIMVELPGIFDLIAGNDKIEKTVDRHGKNR